MKRLVAGLSGVWMFVSLNVIMWVVRLPGEDRLIGSQILNQVKVCGVGVGL